MAARVDAAVASVDTAGHDGYRDLDTNIAEAAVRAAVDFGFEVMLASDACATRPLTFSGRGVPADTVQATTLAVLNGAYTRVMTTSEILAILK